MPNHVTNKLAIISDEARVKEVKDFLKIEKTKENQEVYGVGTIDFNKIIPMPEDLHIQAHGGIITAAENAVKESFSKEPLLAGLERMNREKSKSPLEFDDEEWELFIKLLNNRRKYGAFTWYEWANEYWGTKWNAYGQPDKRTTINTIYFQTAWSCPFDLMKKMSQMFPYVEFEIAWADENLGHNIGIVGFKNAEILRENIPEGGSIEAKKMFFEITQDTPDQHGMNAEYEYIDEN